jgi:hypothetical protein
VKNEELCSLFYIFGDIFRGAGLSGGCRCFYTASVVLEIYDNNFRDTRLWGLPFYDEEGEQTKPES